MGNKLATQGNPQLDFYLHDLPGTIIMESPLGNSALLKCIKCIHDEGPVVVKVYIKRPPYTELKEYVSQLTALRDTLALRSCANVCPSRKFIITDKAGYMIRQYFAYNLHDRIAARPFLAPTEKTWITFQLLKALQECSFYGICHGDIKSENVMLTSWNWVYLADFATYKPTHIPEDGPSEFSFFFDNSGRRTCYLAPERFISGKDVVQGEHTHESDIFSLGCVIAELFLDGVPRTIFTLAQLLSYRKGEYNPASTIERIDSEPARRLITQMISKEPSERRSSTYHLSHWKEMGFPAYYEALHTYMRHVMTQQPDDIIATLAHDLDRLVLLMRGHSVAFAPAEADGTFAPPADSSPEASASFSRSIDIPADLPQQYVEEYVRFASSLSTDGSSLLCDTDSFLMNLESHGALGSSTSSSSSTTTSTMSAASSSSVSRPGASMPNGAKQRAPLVKEAIAPTWSPPTATASPQPSSKKSEPREELPGMILILSLLCSHVRHIQSPAMRVLALQLFVRISPYCDDNGRLQRIVPYIISLLHDDSAAVRAGGIRSLSHVLDDVQQVPASDVHVFPEYILPAIEHLAADPEAIVKEAFAQEIAQMAEVSRRFLEASQVLLLRNQQQLFTPSGGRGQDRHRMKFGNYDASLQEIHELFSQIISGMFWKDCPSCVKQALLRDMARLARFLGKKKTTDFLLPLVVTFLNENDWELRSAFFQYVVDLCEYVGGHSLESFVYPCILQSLSDKEEFVIVAAVNSLTSMTERDLFRRQTLYDIARKSSPLLLHPNIWIRHSEIGLISSIAQRLDIVDRFAFLTELIRPFLTVDLVQVTCEALEASLRPPISRALYEGAIHMCNTTLQAWASAASSQTKPTGSSVGGSRASHPYDPNDSFILLFIECMQQRDVPADDQTLILLMSPYIKDVARHIVSAESRQNLNVLASDRISIPSHAVTLPTVGDAVAPVHRVAADPRWRYLTDFLLEEEPTGFRKGGGGKVSEEKRTAQLLQCEQLHTPPPLPDFGKLRKGDNGHPIVLRGETLRTWRPSGVLVAHLTEHKAAVNQLRITEDNQFFASASNDGTVRIWDCQRLEKKVTNRSRLVYEPAPTQGERMMSLAVLDKSHTLACGSDLGHIRLVRVDIDSGRREYKQCCAIERAFQTESAVNVLEAYNKGAESLLVCGTSAGYVHGFDIRVAQSAFKLNNSGRSGTITSMLVDPQRHWLLTGTIRGCYTCWDLRFGVPVGTWWQPGTNNSIYRLAYRAGNTFLATVGNGEVYEWDVCDQQPRAVWQVLSSDPRARSAHAKESKETSPTPILAGSHAPAPAPPDPQAHAERLRNMPPHSRTHRALCVMGEGGYFLTGSADKCIRYWSLTHASRSYVVSGLSAEASQPRYYSERQDPVDICQEIPTSQFFTGFNSGPVLERSLTPHTGHHDAILDIITGEQPLPMLISGSRDGVIKVWK